jgi:hypothetical protein
MTDSGTVKKVASANAGYKYDNMPTEILWNVAVKAPANGETGAITGPESTSKVHYYYPIKGNYDFYGYHVDDAAFTEKTTTTGEGDAAQTTTEKTASELKVVGNDLTLDVTIDGSQDLLVAKADWAKDLGSKGSEFYPNAGGYKYGAYAARREVHPTLEFQHLLTQLQFSVENESQDNAITVTSINVTSKYTATMTVAGENFGTIAWKEATKKLEVQQKAAAGEEPKAMEALKPVTLEKNSTEAPIGNLLVAASGEDALITMYEGEITLQQTLDATTVGNDNALELTEDVVVTQTVPFKIALPATNVHPNFLAGHAYNVKIYVYGLSLIKVTADLTAWRDGGGFEVTPEDQVNTGENATFTPTEKDKGDAFKYESIKLYNTLTGTKSFGEKSDTLLAYLASGYSVAKQTITRAGESFVYDATTYGEIDFAPYADEEGNVSVTTTLTAKNTWAAKDLIKDAWLVKDEATHNMLPESYLKDHPYTEEFTAPTLPWLAVVFEDAIYADILAITVESPDGSKKEISYPDVKKKVSLLTLNAEELGTELVAGTWKVTVNNSVAEIVVPAPTTDESEGEEEGKETPADPAA